MRILFGRLPFVLLLLPRRNIVKNAASGQLLICWKLLQPDLVELHGSVVVKHHDAPALLQPQEFVRLDEIALGIAPRLRVGTGGTIHRRKEWGQRKLIVGDGDRDLAALFGEVFGAGHIVAAHVEGHVKGAELVLPLHTRILFLPLGQALHRYLYGHIEASNGVKDVGDALHVADVEVFLQAEVRQYGKPSAVESRVVG